jgi:hypothetical protein
MLTNVVVRRNAGDQQAEASAPLAADSATRHTSGIIYAGHSRRMALALVMVQESRERTLQARCINHMLWRTDELQKRRWS